MQCPLCNGTGYTGPKNDTRTPFEGMVIGCCTCWECHGSGEISNLLNLLPDIDPELEKTVDMLVDEFYKDAEMEVSPLLPEPHEAVINAMVESSPIFRVYRDGKATGISRGISDVEAREMYVAMIQAQNKVEKKYTDAIEATKDARTDTLW